MTKSFAGERDPVSHRQSYVTGIDGLRAIAVLSVLIYHIRPEALPGGFVGVDFFFVISGYVVSLATSALAKKSPGGLLLAFYRRRVVRILPASLILLLVVTLLATLFIPINGRLTSTDMTNLAAVVGAANVLLWWTAGDYFSAGTELNPFTHMWSLGVEEQFYIAFPILAFCIWFSDNRAFRRIAIGALIALCVVSLGIAAYSTEKSQNFAFYMLPARFWELGVGVLLFRVTSGRSYALSSLWVALITMVAAGLLIFSLFATQSMPFPFPGALIPVTSALLFIFVAAAAPNASTSRFLSLPPLRYLGRISYSLYLWHWAVIVLMKWTVGIDTIGLQIFAAASSWVLADLSYRIVERKISQSAWLQSASDARVILLGIGGMAVTGILVSAMILGRPMLSQSVTRDTQIWSASTVPTDAECAVERLRSPIGNGATEYEFRRTTCAPAKTGRVYVIGDSHASAYQRMFAHVAAETGMTATVIVSPGCAAVPGVVTSADEEARCVSFLDEAYAALPKDLGQNDVLFLPGLRIPRLRNIGDEAIVPSAPARAYSNDQVQAQAAVFSAILDKGARVILEAPKPIYRYAPLRCSDWFNANNPHCRVPAVSRQEMIAKRAPVMRIFERLKAAEPRLEIWDPFDPLCSTPLCSPMRAGMPLVSDGDHSSGYGNDYLFPFFNAVLTQQTTAQR